MKIVYKSLPDERPALPVDLSKVKKLSNKFKAKKTFSTELSQDKLKQLRELLIEHSLIPSDTGVNQFINIFSGQLLTRDIEPVKWLGSKEALRYFLELLCIPVRKNQIADCIVDRTGKPFIISKPNRSNIIGKPSRSKLDKIIFSI